MNAPMDPTPTVAVPINPKGRVNTTQAMLVSLIGIGIFIGGGVVTIKRDVSDVAKDLNNVSKDVQLLKEAVFGNKPPKVNQ